MAQSKLVRFLVVGIIVLVLLSSGEVLAQGTSEPTWKLVETRINPSNEPTELIAGVTPGYLPSPRYDGTFDKYTIGETYFLHKRRVMDRGVSIATAKSVLQADCEMRADFTKPPEILVPGETINLTASVSGTGTSPGIGSRIQFTYRADGINLRNETSVSTGSGEEPPFRTRSISPYFVVPETHNGEISIHAFLWNVGAAYVIWIYRAQDSTPSEEEEEYTLTLKHYPPYYEPKDGEPGRAGDLVATLTDKNGKGVSGKKVFFYVEPGTNLKGALEYPLSPPKDWIRIRQNFPKLSYIGYAYTSSGVARRNYIMCIRPDVLSKRIRDTGENITGPIIAAVFNQELTAIEQEASVVVEFSGVARITEVISRTKKDKAKVRVTRESEGTKAVYGGNDIPKGGLSTGARCTPYDLLCGDIILLDENDFIDVHWLTGTKMKIQPKTGFLKENQLAKVHIGGKDAGWVRTMGSKITNPYLGLGLGGSGFCVGAYHTVTGLIASIPGIFMIGWAIGEYNWEPLIIQFHSTILIDFDKTATVYTVEGTGRLYNIKDNSTTDVTTGRKISVSPDGTFSHVSEFNESELNDDLSYILGTIQEKSDNFNHIVAQQAVQKVLIGQNLQFDGFNTTPVTVSRIVSGDIVNVYPADAVNRIYNVNWQTSGAFYVNCDPTINTYDAQLSVEEPDMPLVLKVGTNEVSSIAAGTNLIIDTSGMNLFPEDQVDLVVIGPDGQIKHDEVNDQQFTNITLDYLTSNYGDADNALETAGWGTGAHIFWVKTDSEYACGLDAVSNVKPLKILKGSITIKAETASTVERETVKLTVMGVAGDPITVESSPLSDNVLFKDGIDDTPTGTNYHVNWFTDTIDADGIRRYAVEFNDMEIYTIKVTVTGGDREGDSDTVEITVLEKEVPLNPPAPIPSELEISEIFTSKSVYPKGEKVDVHYYITNTGTVDLDDYHVEYDIIDVKGKTVYENVGGAHSISAGDENKWHSEMWEIPSNAEYGPYTVKARLKWDSRIDTKTTDFFVTLATKTEDPRAELEIAELYTSKSAYLKGENVKVCYHIKNVGTVDVYEYHVKYEIRGVDGEKICWFILSPHRIAAGEKQAWCPTENWKIPSNAESGTHTVEATLIWGSKTAEKKTAFLVKPN